MTNNYSYQSALTTGRNIVIMILLLAFIGSVLVNFLFLSKKNEGKFKGFTGWLYDVLSFKKLMAEHLLRILCMFFILLVIGFGITVMFAANPLIVLLVMIVLIIVIRLLYEFSVIKIITCQNTSEINRKLGKGGHDTSGVEAPKQKICPNCGNILEPDDVFCPFCGREL